MDKKVLTEDQITAKAKEISEKIKEEVTPVVIVDKKTGEQIVGYMREPEYDVILHCTDLVMDKKMSSAGEAALRSMLIEEESNERIVSDAKADAKIRAGFALATVKLVTPYYDTYKKK